MIALRVPVRRPSISAWRLSAVVGGSLVAAWVHENHDPGALCPLRRLTGVPCPLCGSTTVFMEAGAGHWTAALLANPMAVVATLIFLLAPALGVDPVAVAGRLPANVRRSGLAVILFGSWLWQLHRFGFLAA
jgi:Protein of unknown function (DUF2752)